MEHYRVLAKEEELDLVLEKIEKELEGTVKSVLHNGDKYYICYEGKEYTK